MPVLQGQRCYNILINAPNKLTFTLGFGERQHAEVNLSPAEWRVTPHRHGWRREPASDLMLFDVPDPNRWERAWSVRFYRMVRNLGSGRRGQVL
jgi:hypothetical protein